MSDAMTHKMLVVMARGRARSGKSHGHISVAVFQRGLYLDGWGSYPKGVVREPDLEIHLYDTAAARSIEDSDEGYLRQLVASDQAQASRWSFFGDNDCTDWVLRILRRMGFRTPTDRLLPVSLARAFQKHPDWTPYQVPYAAPIQYGGSAPAGITT